ncbi:M23 family metallopeptidase [Streptomyces uncialis]|uniref:M23 family metallopeptidase n=1 Tax=Streptomyces uncialis TaxID=1048205 RepID=UPI0022586B9B|nr:M23 family metallopeptidase [Streptomyces uncialis]MCX4664834.1 M23 family metallopeptidase [Streptomyces uncialis]
MASNRPAPEPLYAPKPTVDGPHASSHGQVFGPAVTDDEVREVWNPTAETVRPVRGRHRVAKQRGGLARSSTVLGVGVIAAVGAGGIATAQGGKPPIKISMPDLGSMMSGDEKPEDPGTGPAQQAAAPLTSAGVTGADAAEGTTDAGEVLRARILQQAEQQQDQADTAARAAAEKKAADQAAQDAAAAEAELKAKAKAEAEAKAKKAEEKAKAEAEAKRLKEEAEARAKAEKERLEQLARSFSLPLASFTLTSTYGQSGAMWSSGSHTGLDFAAPTGTPLKAIHSGTITEAGWSGSYGYLTVLTLDDGTELRYAHQSSIGVSVGQKVSTGEIIGRVGATGNVTGAHLHLEVKLGSGSVDPAAYLRGKGLSI